MSHRDRTSSGSHKAKEVKYERVEKMHIDGTGQVNHREVREDQGGEDPYLNFKDKRPDDLMPGEAAGVVPHLVTAETIEAARLKEAAENTSRHSSVSTRAVDSDYSSIHSAAIGNVEKTTTVTTRSREMEPEYTQVVTGGGAPSAQIVSAVNLGPSEYYDSPVRTSSVSSHVSAAPSLGRHTETYVREDLTTTGMSSHASASLDQRDRPLDSEVKVRRTAVTSAGGVSQGLRTLHDIELESSSGGSHHLARADSGLEYQRTEVVTHGGPSIGGMQRTVVVPTGAHAQIHQETEVIRHGHATPSETHVIQVPVTTFGHTDMESVRTGFTVTEDKPLTIAAPSLAAPIRNHLDVNLGGGAHAEIHAATTVDLSAVQRPDMGPEEYTRYKAKVEALARRDERETGLMAAEYRNEVERDAELIRQILERQHIRDLEFRKEMIEKQVNRQEEEIQLEAEYALRALELERQAAREALETAKAQTHVDVRVDTAVGTTISRGDIDTHAERHTRQRVEPVVETTTTVQKQYSSTHV